MGEETPTDSFQRFLAEGAKRSPKLYGAAGVKVDPRQEDPKVVPPPPKPVIHPRAVFQRGIDRKSAAAGESEKGDTEKPYPWSDEDAEVVEDSQFDNA